MEGFHPGSFVVQNAACFPVRHSLSCITSARTCLMSILEFAAIGCSEPEFERKEMLLLCANTRTADCYWIRVSATYRRTGVKNLQEAENCKRRERSTATEMLASSLKQYIAGSLASEI
jgi:hypothetical protein